MKQPKIWTLGHSTRTLPEFIEIIKNFNIEVLVDIRSYPGSKKFPHFNKETLSGVLTKNKVRYIHLPELGGRRKAQKDSKNTAWKNPAFRGYADYMETQDFKNGIERLTRIAEANSTAYMCSEAVWWRCHRSMVSDYLKSGGWNVIHIMGLDKSQEHPYTSAARIVEGKLDYRANDLGF
jgi:uncharacterized protein (DUF488 family)